MGGGGVGWLPPAPQDRRLWSQSPPLPLPPPPPPRDSKFYNENTCNHFIMDNMTLS